AQQVGVPSDPAAKLPIEIASHTKIRAVYGGDRNAELSLRSPIYWGVVLHRLGLNDGQHARMKSFRSSTPRRGSFLDLAYLKQFVSLTLLQAGEHRLKLSFVVPLVQNPVTPDFTHCP